MVNWDISWQSYILCEKRQPSKNHTTSGSLEISLNVAKSEFKEKQVIILIKGEWAGEAAQFFCGWRGEIAGSRLSYSCRLLALRKKAAWDCRAKLDLRVLNPSLDCRFPRVPQHCFMPCMTLTDTGARHSTALSTDPGLVCGLLNHIIFQASF